jgi:hypothetical protein
VPGRTVIRLVVPGFIGLRRAEGGNFDDLVTKVEVGQAEPSSHQAAVAENPLYLAGSGVGYQIEVLRLPSQKEVAYAPSHEVGYMAVIPQAVE